MKKNAIFLAPGLVLLLTSSITGGILLYYLSFISDRWSTAWFVGVTLSPIGVLILFLFSAGLTLVFTGLLRIFFNQNHEIYCSYHTTRIALGISAAGAIGSAIGTFGIMTRIFGKVATEQSAIYPFIITWGILSFLTILILVYFYFIKRKAYPSKKGIMIDLLTAIVYYPLFFFAVCLIFWIIQFFR